MMTTGIVKWFNAQKQYGFIHPDDGGGDVFLRPDTKGLSELGAISEGTKVKFEMRPVEGGKMAAINIARLG